MLFLMIFACSDKTDTDDIDGVDTSSLSKIEECETFEDTDGSVYPREAATAYAWGEYIINGSSITGTEKIYLLPTDAWENEVSSQPDWEDCELVWAISAEEVDPTVGNYALSVTATFQAGQSTCPDFAIEMYDDDFTSTYNIELADDGTSTWYYASSGNQFGVGTHTATSLNFLSDPVCESIGNVQTQ